MSDEPSLPRLAFEFPLDVESAIRDLVIKHGPELVMDVAAHVAFTFEHDVDLKPLPKYELTEEEQKAWDWEADAILDDCDSSTIWDLLTDHLWPHELKRASKDQVEYYQEVIGDDDESDN